MLIKCPSDMKLAEVFAAYATARPAPDSTLWHRTGYTCYGAGGPASSLTIQDELKDIWRIGIPQLNPAASPTKNTFVNLLNTFSYNQVTEIPDQKRIVATIPVTFRAKATRSVACTPECTFTSPSTFIFSTAGIHRVSAKSRWHGTYDALGLTNLPASDSDVIQTATLSVIANEVRTRLVAN